MLNIRSIKKWFIGYVKIGLAANFHITKNHKVDLSTIETDQSWNITTLCNHLKVFVRVKGVKADEDRNVLDAIASTGT